jgi:hypothetical protein
VDALTFYKKEEDRLLQEQTKEKQIALNRCQVYGSSFRP